MNAAFALSSSCVIASLVAGALAPSCGAAGQDRAKVEREVYGAVLKDSRVVGLLQFGAPRRSLVMSETVVLGDQGWLRPRMSAGRAGGLRQLVPGAANATVEDLERVTAERLDLTRLLADMDDVTLISPSEVGDIFAGRDGWERQRFAIFYPDSIGYVEVPRIGLSRDRTEALLYVGHPWAPRGAPGQFVLLRRTRER